MELFDIKPRKGSGTYRLDDSDDLVLMDNILSLPPEKICPKEHGIVVICTEGYAQFRYDGVTIEIQKNDFFLYMVNSTGCNFAASPDFNCRQIWFTHTALHNIYLHSDTNLTDMSYLKLHPLVHLTGSDVSLLDNYFHLLCQRMSSPPFILQKSIVRSLFGSMLLEMLSMIRRTKGVVSESVEERADVSLRKKQLVDKFMQLVEQSDGRNRRVDYFADQLCITPKYLSIVMKEVMHRKPSIYIQLFTLKSILHRLCFTDMTVQEIANDLHFPSASFLGKYFKQHEGMTPLEFRTKYHSEELKIKEL